MSREDSDDGTSGFLRIWAAEDRMEVEHHTRTRDLWQTKVTAKLADRYS